MVRDIIEIDEAACTGCGECVPGCHEGALQIIEGKARLISEIMCDGLGACVGHCPTGAMKVIRREAPAYDEVRVMKENIIPAGLATVKAHLAHLEDHNETEYLAQAKAVLAEMGIDVAKKPGQTPTSHGSHAHHGGGCPGSRNFSLGEISDGSKQAESPKTATEKPSLGERNSSLGQWPVQLHLLHPSAPFLRGSDLLLAADCTAYARADFHETFLPGKTLAIACPKLDSGIESYVDKLTMMIAESGLRSIQIMMMEVPCCSGLKHIVQQAMARAGVSIPVTELIISVDGKVLAEQPMAV